MAISPFEAQGQLPKTRSNKEVYEAYDVLWNLVWYYRKVIMESHGKLHPVSLPGMRKVEQRFPEAAAHFLSSRVGPVAQIFREEGLSDFEWGMLQGQMSALSWALGAEWEESLDA